jgi:hypothetical protein
MYLALLLVAMGHTALKQWEKKIPELLKQMQLFVHILGFDEAY